MTGLPEAIRAQLKAQFGGLQDAVYSGNGVLFSFMSNLADGLEQAARTAEPEDTQREAEGRSHHKPSDQTFEPSDPHLQRLIEAAEAHIADVRALGFGLSPNDQALDQALQPYRSGK